MKIFFFNKNSSLQISNISMVGVAPMPDKEIQLWMVILIALGLCMIGMGGWFTFLAFVAIICGGA